MKSKRQVVDLLKQAGTQTVLPRLREEWHSSSQVIAAMHGETEQQQQLVDHLGQAGTQTVLPRLREERHSSSQVIAGTRMETEQQPFQRVLSDSYCSQAPLVTESDHHNQNCQDPHHLLRMPPLPCRYHFQHSPLQLAVHVEEQKTIQ